VDGVCRQRRAAFLKWEPGIFEAGDPPLDFTRHGFHASTQTIQPPRTILIDISGDDESILARMNQGTRRKIRQSQKNSVRYYEASRDDLVKFTRMMQTTGSRNDFGVHEPSYYSLAYDLFVPQHAALILADQTESETEDQPARTDDLAGVFVFAIGKTAWYFYGASSNLKRNLMASFGAQWAAIQWAKRRGCTVYDMWGIPDEGEATLEAQFESRDDGLWGIYGFKRGWGGRVVRSAGAWDKVYNPIVYAAFQLALRVRNRTTQVEA
jgi:lipid II:glycine glycyltransferase (peptidoglycan interpeptide bridge formation enzyme)